MQIILKLLRRVLVLILNGKKNAVVENGKNMNQQDIIKLSAEQRFAEELATLTEHDHAPRPQGWLRSPKAVRQFILGDEKPAISRKFYGDDALVDRSPLSLYWEIKA